MIQVEKLQSTPFAYVDIKKHREFLKEDNLTN